MTLSSQPESLSCLECIRERRLRIGLWKIWLAVFLATLPLLIGIWQSSVLASHQLGFIQSCVYEGGCGVRESEVEELNRRVAILNGEIIALGAIFAIGAAVIKPLSVRAVRRFQSAVAHPYRKHNESRCSRYSFGST